MPELATSSVAAFRKQPDIATGNVVGSNVFNILGYWACPLSSHRETQQAIGSRLHDNGSVHSYPHCFALYRSDSSSD
ncbi:hypothetical protein [Vreelandella sp. V005]|uniref:hypothetical protein n=1 Tax=Vreelandella sp. V005 TaxID=3459608 RepID=UPI004044C4D6